MLDWGVFTLKYYELSYLPSGIVYCAGGKLVEFQSQLRTNTLQFSPKRLPTNQPIP